MTTDSNYITSMAGAAQKQVEADINESVKVVSMSIDNVLKAELKAIESGGWKGKVDDFLANVQGVQKSKAEFDTIREQTRINREWKRNLTPDNPEMQQYNDDLNLLDKGASHLRAAGYAELRKDNPDVDFADKATTGDTGRRHRNSKLRNGASTYNPYLQRGASSFAIVTPWSNGNKVTIKNAESLDEVDFIMEKLRYGYWRNFQGDNKGALNKYLFPEMRKAEETFRNKWIADRAVTVGESAEAQIRKDFSEDVAARGAEAAIDYINNNANRWPGSASFQRSKAVDEFIDMLESGDLSLARAEQILDKEFFAWDGSKQTPYDNANPNKKPYWPEFEKLAAKINKMKTEKSNDRIRAHNAAVGIFKISMVDKGKERLKNGQPIDDEFRRQITKQWEEQFPGLPQPREVASLMTSGESDDDESIRGLWAKYNRIGSITEEDLLRAGIDDQEKLAKAYKDFGVNREGVLDTSRMKNNITSWVNDEAERTDLTKTKSESWHEMNRRATTEYVSTYTNARKDGYSHTEATDKAEDLVRKNVKDGIYRQPVERPDVDDDVHKNTLKALKAIQTDSTILDREVLPGFEKNAEAVYRALELGKPLPTGPFKSLLYRPGIEGIDARKAAAVQANLWAKSKGLKEIPLPESRVDTVLKNKPASVTKDLNKGDLISAFNTLSKEKDTNIVDLLTALERPESINNGKHNAILTTEGWKNSENVLPKPLEQYTIKEAMALNLPGITAYGFSNVDIEEARPWSGLDEDAKLTAENARLLFFGLTEARRYRKETEYNTLTSFNTNSKYVDWNIKTLQPGEKSVLISGLGPKGWNNPGVLLDAIT
jgi:hypothetical protein